MPCDRKKVTGHILCVQLSLNLYSMETNALSDIVIIQVCKLIKSVN